MVIDFNGEQFDLSSLPKVLLNHSVRTYFETAVLPPEQLDQSSFNYIAISSINS